ncbi:MAG: segregation/condensation protein A [Raoultibacter sp.]
MSYRVRIDSFEGPFDLLLYLVSRQKVAIGAICVTDIADQYLSEVLQRDSLDLDVASDFLLVAATLLEIKAASLIPHERSDEVDEFDDIAPSEARDILVARLLDYKKFKNAAAALQVRQLSEGRMHARLFGPDPSFLRLLPDYLRDTSLDTLSYACAQAFARHDSFLLESEHIAAKPLPVEMQVRAIHRRIVNSGHVAFSELVNERTPTPVVVVTFLAVLELYKRAMVTLEQKETFGDIEIDYIQGSGELILGDEDMITSTQIEQEG